MDAHVGYLATAVVEEPAELIEAAVAVIWHLRRGAHPGFPIKGRRRRTVGRFAGALGPLVLNMEAARSRALSQSPAPHKLRRFAAHCRGAAIQAGLAKPPVPLHSLDHRAPPGYARREQ